MNLRILLSRITFITTIVYHMKKPRSLAGILVWSVKWLKKLILHVILVIYFKFWIENAYGECFHQFLLDIGSFWYIIYLCRCSEQKGHQSLSGYQYIASPLVRPSVRKLIQLSLKFLAGFCHLAQLRSARRHVRRNMLRRRRVCLREVLDDKVVTSQ